MVWLMACGTVVALIGAMLQRPVRRHRHQVARQHDALSHPPESWGPSVTPATPRTVLRVGPAAQVRGELAHFTDEESSGPHATSQPA